MYYVYPETETHKQYILYGYKELATIRTQPF